MNGMISAMIVRPSRMHLLAIAMILIVIDVSQASGTELPPLLRNVGAGGGKWPSCPSEGTGSRKDYALLGAYDITNG